MKEKKQYRHLFLIYLLIFFLWLIYRMFFKLPEWIDEFIAKPILWLTPIIIFSKQFFPLNKVSFKQFIYKILFGLGISLLYIFIFHLPTLIDGKLINFNFNNFFLNLLISFATATTEELVFRQFFLKKQINFSKNKPLSILLNTLLFVIIHLPIMIFIFHYSLASILTYCLTLTLSSLVYSLTFIASGSIISPIIVHALWNLFNDLIT